MFGGSEWLFSVGATPGGTMGQQAKERHMRAVVITEPGESEVMQWLDVPDPYPGPGEAVIDVAASGVNRADLMQRQGSTRRRRAHRRIRAWPPASTWARSCCSLRDPVV
jgi:hypothetical protein